MDIPIAYVELCVLLTSLVLVGLLGVVLIGLIDYGAKAIKSIYITIKDAGKGWRNANKAKNAQAARKR